MHPGHPLFSDDFVVAKVAQRISPKPPVETQVIESGVQHLGGKAFLSGLFEDAYDPPCHLPNQFSSFAVVELIGSGLIEGPDIWANCPRRFGLS